MKKAAIFFVLLVLIFALGSFFTADVSVAEGERCWESEQIFYCDGETYQLKNETGNREILATHTSDKITLSTTIKINLIIKFSDNMNKDEFTLKLITEKEDGLILTFNNTKDEGQFIREIRAEFYREGKKENCQTIKEINYLFSEKTSELSSNIDIRIEYSENTYILTFNSEQIELKADIEEETKAKLSLALKSGEASFHSPEIKIVNTTLIFKEQEEKEDENPGEETETENPDLGETETENPNLEEKEDEKPITGETKEPDDKAGESGAAGGLVIKGLKNETNDNQTVSVIITVAASIVVAGTVFLIIWQRKRNFKRL